MLGLCAQSWASADGELPVCSCLLWAVSAVGFQVIFLLFLVPGLGGGTGLCPSSRKFLREAGRGEGRGSRPDLRGRKRPGGPSGPPAAPRTLI